MTRRRLQILVAEPSYIIRRGIVSVLLDMEFLGADVVQVEDMSLLRQEIAKVSPDVVVLNPYFMGIMSPKELLSGDHEVKFVALQNYISSSDQLKNYAAVISLSDSSHHISAVMGRLLGDTNKANDDELSQREREIVTAIALGKSNKEIAETLFISAHTVMTHRKNIASKLKIHNPAGLTIYAIVNKLIDVNDVT